MVLMQLDKSLIVVLLVNVGFLVPNEDIPEYFWDNNINK